MTHRFEGGLQVLVGRGRLGAVQRTGLLAGLAHGRLLVLGLCSRRRHLFLVLFLGHLLKVIVQGLRDDRGR